MVRLSGVSDNETSEPSPLAFQTLPRMPPADQHSDLLFDFGPKGAADHAALDWVPADARPFDSQVEVPMPTFDLASTHPLPALGQLEGAVASQTPDSKGGFWLDGDVLMCSCPECQAPMSVRVWLMIADCWNCGASIELSDQQIREVEALLESKKRPAPTPAVRPAPVATPPTPPAPLAPPPMAKAQERPVAQPVARFRGEPASEKRIPAPVAPPPAPTQPRTTPARPPRVQEPERDSLEILKALFRDMPAWLLSFIIHLALLMLLALVQFQREDEGPTITLSATVSREKVEDGGDVLKMPQTDQAKFDLPLPQKNDLDDPTKREALLVANQEARELRLDPDALDSHLPDIDFLKEAVGSSTGIKRGLAARDPRLRVEMVKREGGTTLTEAAVARSLRWFQRHQNEDGSWSLNDFRSAGKCSCGNAGHMNDDTAGTALALLPYLGAGQTHLVGIYQNEIAKGLRWLIKHQKEDGDLRVTHGTSGMYAQGQAAIVLCEAFAMTGDEELRVPAQRAIDFILQAQYNDGGWRYTTSPANQEGDTSVVGWQLMALQSARSANLTVPEQAFHRANGFLDRVQHGGGSLYSYQRHSGPTPTMTAEGLLCRLYLGWNKDRRGLGDGVKSLVNDFPPSRGDGLGIYYWYYATQTMHHYGGKEWEQWNSKMRDVLVDSQQKEGHAAGSWEPIGQHSDAGGRVFMTALSACTLEVYYRHLPIFRQIKVE